MPKVIPEPALPVDTDGMPWIATGPGKSFRPLRFAADGWSELMRLEPGSSVALHRHTGEVHAFNIRGTREILGSGELVRPGGYVYEPAGTVDGWGAVGDEPCVVHIKVAGTIEYLDERPGHRVRQRRNPACRLPGLVPGSRRAPIRTDPRLTRPDSPPRRTLLGPASTETETSRDRSGPHARHARCECRSFQPDLRDGARARSRAR